MSFLLYSVYGFYQLNIKGQGTRDSTIQNENHVCKKGDSRSINARHAVETDSFKAKLVTENDQTPEPAKSVVIRVCIFGHRFFFFFFFFFATGDND